MVVEQAETEEQAELGLVVELHLHNCWIVLQRAAHLE
jgi:hypothetical protein